MTEDDSKILERRFFALYPGLCAAGEDADNLLLSGDPWGARSAYLRLIGFAARDFHALDRHLCAKALLGLVAVELRQGWVGAARRLLEGEIADPIVRSAVRVGRLVLQEGGLSDDDQARYETFRDMVAGRHGQPIARPAPWDATRQAQLHTLFMQPGGGANLSAYRWPESPTVDPVDVRALPVPFQWERRAALQTQFSHVGTIQRLILSSAEDRVAVRGGNGVSVHEFPSGNLLGWLEADREILAFSADSQYLLTSHGEELETWRCEGLVLAHRQPAIAARVLAPDGRMLAGESQGHLAVYDVHTQQIKRLRAGDGVSPLPQGLDFSGDHRWLGEAAGAKVRVWDTASGAVVYESQPMGREVTCLRMRNDAVFCATAGRDVWRHDIPRRQVTMRFGVGVDVRSIDVGTDERLIVAGAVETLDEPCFCLLDRLLQTCERIPAASDARTVLLTPGCDRVLIGHDDDTVRIWTVPEVPIY